MMENISKIESELYNIPLFGKKVGHKNIERIIDELNKIIEIKRYLEEAKIIHVTGTNGKGSVCKMLNEIYLAEKYSVGLFTSPHINHITERIQVNGKNVEEELFIEGFRCIEKIVKELNKENLEPTFFEWVFAISLYCFCKLSPKVLIIEVGIGGRLDTTNVLPKKLLSVMTPIGLDHQGVLGNTISEIAKEKAGIIKNEGKVVLFNNQEVVNTLVENEASRLNAKIYEVLPISKKIIDSNQLGIDFSIHNKYYYYEKLRLSVGAHYQVDNVSIALTAIHAIQNELPVSESSIREGIKTFHWPGRFELLANNIIVDGAHNELGAQTLIDSIKHAFGDTQIDLLFGMKEGKNVDDVVKQFKDSGCFKHFYIIDITIQKPVPKEIIVDKLKMNSDKVTIVNELKPFLLNYLQTKKNDFLIGAGSLYLVSEIRKIILEEDLK